MLKLEQEKIEEIKKKEPMGIVTVTELLGLLELDPKLYHVCADKTKLEKEALVDLNSKQKLWVIPVLSGG